MKFFTKGIISALLLLCMLSTAAMAQEVNLSVAASMKDVVNQLTDTFAKKNSKVKFIKNYGSSGSVAKQIANGAPADIFISANQKWMAYLKDMNLMDNQSIDIFAHNKVVFVGKTGVTAKNLRDLVKLKRIAIGSPQSVPAGDYAMTALKKSGMDKMLQRKLVMAKDVRACLMYAELGEVDGSFVYKTDALEMAKNTKILFTVPQELYPRVTYPKGLTVAGSRNKAALNFFRFLDSSEAKAILAQHGFAVK